MRGTVTLDRIAASLSSVCLAHCVALPLIALALPVASGWLGGGGHDHRLHGWLLAVAVPVSAWALVVGWRRHGRPSPTLLAAAGFATMGVALWLTGAAEAALTVLGGLAVAAAHVRNASPPADRPFANRVGAARA